VITTSWLGRKASGMKALNCSVLATRLRCDSAAPFESPVVPPVYCMVGIGVGERPAEAAERGLVRITLRGTLEHLQHRTMSVRG
jgi:hypothetical protein